jgi:cytidine deaminase
LNEIVAPCGACRQFIAEFGLDSMKVIMSNAKKEYKIVSVRDILPFAFDSGALDRHKEINNNITEDC